MLNSCTFQGRITHKPELRRTQSGKAVTSFSIAVEDDFKNADGEKTTTFVEIVAWGSLAELVDRYLDKGRMVIVSGRLANRDWTDKDGNKRRTTEIIASNELQRSGREEAEKPCPASRGRKRKEKSILKYTKVYCSLPNMW